MKIRTKSGEVIDLAEWRREYSPGEMTPLESQALDILDALEAALSVPITVGPQRTEAAVAYDNGLRDGITMVRQSAGVVP